MSEWWNLDQALIWIATRDPERVERARGDAKGNQDRRFCYLDLECLGVTQDEDEDDDGDETEPGYGASDILLHYLRGGRIKAIEYDDAEANRIPKHLFDLCDLELLDAQPYHVLAASRSPVERAKGTPRSLLFVVVWRPDILALCPPHAPEHLTEDLSALLNAEPRPKGKSEARMLAEAVAARLWPGGFSSAAAGISNNEAIRQVRAELEALGHKVGADERRYRDTIKRALKIRKG